VEKSRRSFKRVTGPSIGRRAVLADAGNDIRLQGRNDLSDFSSHLVGGDLR